MTNEFIQDCSPTQGSNNRGIGKDQGMLTPVQRDAPPSSYAARGIVGQSNAMGYVKIIVLI